MMKWFALVLTLLAGPTSAAQQYYCPTRPPGDNSNACASTAFVIANGGGGGGGSVASVFGRTGSVVAATNDYSVGQLGAIPADTWVANATGSSTNPSYTSIPNCPTSGITYSTATHLFGCETTESSVTGPVSSVNNDIVTFDGTSGSMIKDSGVGIASLALFAPLANPTFTGTVVVPTPAAGSNTTLAASTAFVAGAPHLIATVSCSGATCSDITSLTATYAHYRIILANIVPATNGVTLELQVHSAAAFQATTYLCSGIYTDPTGASAIGGPTTFIQISAPSAAANTAPGLTARIEVNNPSNTTAPKTWLVDAAHAGAVHGFNQITSAGYWNGGNTAIDGFQILFSSGNITSGTIYIYGWN
jgi:hypothetical protein